MELNEILKDKVQRAVSEQKFVGFVQYSESEYQELLAYTSKYSRSFALGNGWYLQGDDEIHFVTLVEIAKRWKSSNADSEEDSGFWTFVYSCVGINWVGEQKIYKAYTELIISLSHTKGLLIANTAKKYYATIMMHAFAPYRSISAFFDFVYNIYKKDLDFNYTDADSEICDMATEGFCAVAQSLGGENVDISIGSSVYGIKIGLRCMAVGNETRRAFVCLLDNVLGAIDLLYHGKELSSDDYLMYLLKEWWRAKSDKDLSYYHDGRVSVTTKQNIIPKFARKEDTVFLCIPPIRFTSGEDPKLWLSLFVGDNAEPILSREIFTRRGEITVTSVQQEIDLNDLLKNTTEINIRIEITENGKVICNKSIERDFIIFDNEKELTNKVLKAGNYFVYSLSIDALQVPIAINTISKNLYNIYPTEDEMLIGPQRQIVFTNKTDASLAPDKIRLVGKNGICTWIYQNKLCKVFGNHINLFVPQNMSINSLELSINGNGILLSNISSTAEKGYLIFDITELIPQRVPCEVIIYSHLKEKELIHHDIVSIQNLRIGFSKPIYYGNDDKRVRISVGAHYKDIAWEMGEDIVSCTLCKGRLSIIVPQFKWRIDNSEWHYEPIKDIIWYKDLLNSGSVLEVQSPMDISTIKLYCVGDGAMQEIPQNISSKFEIGKYVFANEGRKVLAFFLKSIENNDRKEVCETTTIEYFSQEPPFVVENDELRFVGDKFYVGSAKPYFSIALKRIGRDEISIKSTDLHDGVMCDMDKGIYWIKVSVPTGGLFGCGEKVLWEGEFIFGDKDKLKLSNTVLKINPICGIGAGDFWKSNIAGYYISELTREDAPDAYSAKLCYKNVRGERGDVCGFSECRITIISSIALQVYVKNDTGNYEERLKCDSSGNLYEPQTPSKFNAINYHFIEVKNV